MKRTGCSLMHCLSGEVCDLIVCRKVICLYAMHRYDLVFYARLIEALNYSNTKYEYKLLVTDQVYDIHNAEDFILQRFPNYKIVPVNTKPKGGIFAKISTFLKLRAWARYHIDKNDILVLTDKSSPISRFFLKRSSNAILVQQIEEYSGDFKIDLKSTARDAIICMVLGAYYARWYVSSSSGGFVRGLKTVSMPKNIVKLHQVPDSIAPDHFALPPLRDVRQGKLIVIFGSRFLSWPFFRLGIFEHRLELLTQIYAFIHVSFPGHRVIYLQHPAEKGDEFDFLNIIFRGRLDKVDSYFSSEHYLYINRIVDCTFSIGSTSSVSAFNMGFPAKVFYKMLDFSSTIESTYDRIFSGLPSSFFAERIDDLILPSTRDFPNSGLNSLESFAYALQCK
jgi:hypothetical protein